MPKELIYEVSLERSNQIRADLPQHPEKNTMLTGERPTGRLHLGHYFGTRKSRVELQERGVHTTVLNAVHQAIADLDSTDNIVPVGRDQLPHIELTRTIARKFNTRFGIVFPEVDALRSDTPLLPGLDGR